MRYSGAVGMKNGGEDRDGVAMIRAGKYQDRIEESYGGLTRKGAGKG